MVTLLIVSGLCERRFMCVKCGKMYKQRATLTRHLKLECGKAPSYKCPHPFCKYITKRKFSLDMHYRTQHSHV